MKTILLLNFFVFMGLAYSQTIPVEVRSTLLGIAEAACSGSFVTHQLDHVSTVPGGQNVRMFEANGGGVAINDLDNDGDLDIVLANHAEANTILWNLGQLRFRKEEMPIGDSRAVTIVDLDGDGWQDIVFSRRASPPNYWRNLGDGSFEFEVLGNVTKPLYAINWADVDVDGDLDLVGGTYDAGLLTDFGNDFLLSGNAGVYLYENTQGSFSEVRLADQAQALALILFDLDDDGRLDILVGNDFAVPDMAWLNRGDTWDRVAPFVATSHSTMSFDVGDTDNDGKLELFSTDMKPYPDEALEPWLPLLEAMMSEPQPEGDPQVMENVLQERQEGGFINAALAKGIDATGWSWSGKFADFDQDGFLDLYVVNGMIEKTIFAHLDRHELVEENQAFSNDGQGNFVPASQWQLAGTESGRGMSIADLDADGDLDIVVNNVRAPAQLFENQLCRGQSLQVDLIWEASMNRQAIGAVLILHTDKGRYYREISAASGYLSGNASRVHFGFPESESISFLEIIWPDGVVSKIYDATASHLLTVQR